jgi:L-cysteine:1D-myo-inositol 2-amino-2-deoxy-alpha-D-glucopyranoside ligase
MGHAFTYVTFDTINRAWLDAGHEVHYVQNVTDIDDPLLERAVATGQDWVEIAERETALFREDMQALNVIPPREYIGAVESIPSVASHVERLQELGSVYAVDSDLYFRVHSDPAFGSQDWTRRRCSRSSPSAAAIPTAPARSTRSTAWCGRPRAQTSPRGTPLLATAGPAGTSSAPRLPSTTSA